MEKFQSLADILGVQDPSAPDLPVRPAPSAKLTAKAFAKDLLNTPQYRESLMRRIVMDTLPAAVETLLYYYAHGKPTERVEVKDKSERVEDLTPEMVAEKLARVQRMLLLVRAAARSEDQATEGSVH